VGTGVGVGRGRTGPVVALGILTLALPYWMTSAVDIHLFASASSSLCATHVRSGLRTTQPRRSAVSQRDHSQRAVEALGYSPRQRKAAMRDVNPLENKNILLLTLGMDRSLAALPPGFASARRGSFISASSRSSQQNHHTATFSLRH